LRTFVIIVTYNPKKWIEKCFSSIENSTIPLDVIVIDNGSNDGSQEIIKKIYPKVILIQNKENLGFGKANNIGIEIAYKNNADYFFLLNQDAWVESNTIENLIKISQKNSEFGILSPLHFNGFGTQLDLGFKNASKINQDQLTKNELIEVPFVNAAIWLMTRNCIEKIGGFSPVFFHYCEDNNYVARLKFHNLKLGVVTNLKGFHDREFRSENEFYKDNYQILERDLIMTLSDPNLNLSRVKIFLATIINFIKKLFLNIDNQSNKDYIKAIFNIDYKKIIKNRQISKVQKLAFLDL
jgi:GT2 family glycosyltransferase